MTKFLESLLIIDYIILLIWICIMAFLLGLSISSLFWAQL